MNDSKEFISDEAPIGNPKEENKKFKAARVDFDNDDIDALEQKYSAKKSPLADRLANRAKATLSNGEKTKKTSLPEPVEKETKKEGPPKPWARPGKAKLADTIPSGEDKIAEPERPIKPAKDEFSADERPIASKKAELPKEDDPDERPLGGVERPIGGVKPDERAIGGAREDRPIASKPGGYGYNFDNLEELERLDKGYKPSGKVAVKHGASRGNHHTEEEGELKQSLRGGPRNTMLRIEEEAELPGQWGNAAWVDDLSRKPWKERKDSLDSLNDFLSKISRLSPRSEIGPVVDLLRSSTETNILSQMTSMRTLGLLAHLQKKSFASEAKFFLPSLLAKLKEKNRQLVEEILATLDKFLGCLSIEEVLDEILECLRDRGPERKTGVLRLLQGQAELSRFRTAPAVQKTVRAAAKLVDESDPQVSAAAEELLAKLCERAGDKAGPVLREIDPVKFQKFLGAEEVVEPPRPAKLSEVRASFVSQAGRAQETKTMAKVLESSLKSSAEITNNFADMNTGQLADMLGLVAEITSKVDKSAFAEESRRAIATFFAEQLGSSNAEIVRKSAENFANSKLTTPKNFLSDLCEALARRPVLPAPALKAVLRLFSAEAAAQPLANLAIRPFSDLLRVHYSDLDGDSKTAVLSALRALHTRFGDKAAPDLPAATLRDLDELAAEQMKIFQQSLAKLADKNPDKKKQALQDLLTFSEPAKIGQFWAAPQFTSFLRRQLITETNLASYRTVFEVIHQYLELKKVSPSDFSLKCFLSVFGTVIQHYYDKSDRKERAPILRQGFQDTVEALTPSVIYNELLSEPDTPETRAQLLGFYEDYHQQITPDTRFLNLVSKGLTEKKLNPDMKELINSVLLKIKNSEDKELLAKGNESKQVREVWQRNEEDIMFNTKFVQGYRVFNEPEYFNTIKNFLKSVLDLDETHFMMKSIDVRFQTPEPKAKPKFVYFYLRSIENYNPLIEHIFHQVSCFPPEELDDITNALTIRICLNLLKNIHYAHYSENALKIRAFFHQTMYKDAYPPREIFNSLELAPQDTGFAEMLLTMESVPPEEEADPEVENDNQIDRYSRADQHKSQYVRDDTSALNIKHDRQRNSPRSQMQGSIHESEALSDPVIELQMHLEKIMLMFLENLVEAADYFSQMISTPQTQQFLINYASNIMQTYTDFIDTLFFKGIDPRITKKDLEPLFNTLEGLCSVQGFLENLDQQVLNDFFHQISYRLILYNEERVHLEAANREKKEIEFAKFIVDSFNRVLKIVLNYAEPNNLFQALFYIIFTEKERGEPDSENLCVLIYKIIARIVNKLKVNTSRVDPRLIFKLANDFFQTIGTGDKLGTKAVKMIIYDIVMSSDPYFIEDCYVEVFGNQTDTQIARLIRAIEAQRAEGKSGPPDNYSSTIKKPTEADLLAIIDSINKQKSIRTIVPFVEDLKALVSMLDGFDLRQYEDDFRSPEFFEHVYNEINGVSNYSQQPGRTGGAQRPATSSKKVGGAARSPIDDVLNKTEIKEEDIKKRHGGK